MRHGLDRAEEGEKVKRPAGRALVAVFAAGIMAAALAGPAGPQTGIWKTSPRRSALTTGIPLIFHQDKASAMTVIGLFVPGGRAAVPAGLDGLAYLTTRLTLEIPDEGKARDLMAQATRMTFSCDEDFSLVVIECLSGNLEAALRVAGKIIQDPLMTGLRIGRGKEMMALYAQAEEDDAVLVGSNAAFKAFFQGQGYGSSSYGSEASLKAIERKDVVAFFRRHFTSKSVFFSVVSDLDQAPVQALLEKHFSKFPEGERPDVAAAPPVLPEDREVRLAKDSKQTYVGRAYALPAPVPDDHAKGYLVEVLIGRGAGSRLWALRTAERLAYIVDSRLTWTQSAGILEAYLETENTKSDRAAAALDRELRALWEKGVTAAELEATKTMAKAGFLRSAETKSARMRVLGQLEVLGLGFDNITGLFAAIDAISLEGLNAYIQAVLGPDKALRVTVGPDGPEGR
jgi:predicted Zn-dependent peptidase